MSGRAGRKPSTPRGLAGPKAKKTISLALQGGGAHGAFTWGVLDQLIEDGRLAIEAITGASAGSMNAVVLVDGWREGGARGRARAAAQVLEAGQPRGRAVAGAALALRPVHRLLERRGDAGAGLAQRLAAGGDALRVQPARHQPLARRAERAHRLRERARLHRGEAVRRRDQRLDRQDPRLRRAELDRRPHPRLGLPAEDLQGRRDRRRALLGRRLHRQPAAVPAVLRGRAPTTSC